jgi:WD40 repeat protein
MPNPGEDFVTVKDASTGKVRFQIPWPHRIDGLAFDPTGERLAYGDQVGNVVLLDAVTGRPVRQFATRSWVGSIFFLEHPRRLVTHGKSAVLLFDLESGKTDPERTVALADGAIRKLVADRARGRLVAGLQSGALVSVSLPDLTVGPRLEKAHDRGVECLALSPDGRLVASASDHRVVLRDALSFETLFSFPLWDGTVRDLTFDSQGRRLAIVGTDSDVDLWDLAALRDGLTAVGLAWDRPAPAASPPGLVREGEPPRREVPVIRRPVQ